MKKQNGHITTYTKVQFSPVDPHVDDIKIEDIAHALSLMTRANGHFPQFYSVAQHSLDCAREAIAENYAPRTVLACLLHDASEAYLSDITRPVKVYLGEYADIEKRMQDTIYRAFLGNGITQEEMKIVKRIDDTMLYFEFLHFMGEELYEKPADPLYTQCFEERPFKEVEQEFLILYEKYAKNCKEVE